MEYQDADTRHGKKGEVEGQRRQGGGFVSTSYIDVGVIKCSGDEVDYDRRGGVDEICCSEVVRNGGEQRGGERETAIQKSRARARPPRHRRIQGHSCLVQV